MSYCWYGWTLQGHICCLNKCQHDSWNFSNFVKIGSVTTEIWLTLSLSGGGECRVIFTANPTVWLGLGWGFDKGPFTDCFVKHFWLPFFHFGSVLAHFFILSCILLLFWNGSSTDKKNHMVKSHEDSKTKVLEKFGIYGLSSCWGSTVG